MNWVVWGIVMLILLVLIWLFVRIANHQKTLDIPFRGDLIVDRERDPRGFCAVYLQANVDPSVFKDGELIKLRVITKIDESA